MKPVVALLASGKVAKDREHALWLLLARIGGPAELDAVIHRCVGGTAAGDEQRSELMAAAEESVRLRQVGRPADAGVLSALLLSANRPAAKAAARLVGLWKVGESRDALTAALKPESPADEWAAAFEAEARFGDARAKEKLQAAATDPQGNPAARRAAVAALTALDLPLAARDAADLFAAADAREPLADLYAAFLARKGGPAALAKALQGKTLPPDVAKTGLHAVRASVQEAPALTDALTKAGGLGVRAEGADARRGEGAGRGRAYDGRPGPR